MSKMSELSQVLEEMISCGEGMIRAAKTLQKIFSASEEVPVQSETKEAKKPEKAEATEAKQPEAAPAPTYTKEDVRGVLAAKSAAGFKKEVKELLNKFGAQQLKQIDPEDYAALMKEAEVIGNA